MTVEDVMDMYRRVLELGDIAPDSDFFASGGDSLLATRILSGVARQTGIELTFHDFLLASTPIALAERVARVAA